MYERRLKILLAVMVLAGVALFGRAFSLQVVHRADYAKIELQMSTRPPELTATTRGRILDRTGRVMAVDTACTDACVDYRAITDPPDPKWVADVATARVKAKYGADYRHQFPLDARRKFLADAEADVRHDLADMWATLAFLNRPADPQAAADAAADPRAAMDEIRRGIVRQVEMRRRVLWTNAYRKSRDQLATNTGGWRRWLGLSSGPAVATPVAVPDSGDDPDADTGADIDAFQMTTGEQRSPHVVLHALDPDACGVLGKMMERTPCLTLRPSMHRWYPLHEDGCHVLGRVANPSSAELRRTKDADPTRRFEPDDVVGREGLEALCEPLLRGVRGRIDRPAGAAADDDAAAVNRTDFIAGQDVATTIDADLQGRVQQLLKHVVIKEVGGGLVTPIDGVSMHAAVVVLDVRTNEVLALASNPTFDVNDLEARYAALAGDTLEEPLRNRAVVDAMNPGSTAKPMVGLGAITQGSIGPHEGIECTGFLILPVLGPDGRPTGKMQPPYKRVARCWVASEHENLQKLTDFSLLHPDVWPEPIVSWAHHPIPYPHKGIFGNPDGFLCYSDALERSCNVYFETVADRLGPVGIDHWLEAFGIGRPTGIGLYESAGQRPSQARVMPNDPRLDNCFAGIGQGGVLATPLQIANEASTIARGGVWMRPRLLTADTQRQLDAVTRPSPTRPPDAVDLHLDPEGLRQANVGMVAVVEAKPTIWTLAELKRPDWLTVAAKTGTADVSPLTVWSTDAQGKRVRVPLPPVVRGQPETATPWYRTNHNNSSDTDNNNKKEKITVTQNWYMGYAPADHPQVAFAVLIEYAGSSGGWPAAPWRPASSTPASPTATFAPPAGRRRGPTTGPTTGPLTGPTTQP